MSLASPSLSARDRQETACEKGFYKDVFMDAGVMLTSRHFLYAANNLELNLEAFVSTDHKISKNIQADTIIQQMIMVGNPLDENGYLLYPDGAPRYRMIYVNGGRSYLHGPSLGPEGLQRIREFVAGGGSYVGTCAGALLSSSYIRGDSLVPKPFYTHIWPGSVRYTGISYNRTNIALEKHSPLLQYYDFGGDLHVDSVYHNGGVFADEEVEWPKGTEVLARYDSKNLNKERVDGKPVIWAYKPTPKSGRVVDCGSHPELESNGERLQLMSAMMRYAMDGNGNPTIKASLTSGEACAMTASTHDSIPERTKIGDHQYHHFTVDVPKGTDTLTVLLQGVSGWEKCDLYLLARRGELAWIDNATYQDLSLGNEAALTIVAPKAGKWYVSVYGATTVGSVETEKGTLYTDHLEVLNGVPYIITATLKEKKK